MPRPLALSPYTAAVVADACTYIQAHLAEPLRCARLAQVVGYHPCYFHHLFRATLGMSPAAYVRQQRLAQAAWLLTHTRLPVVRIAEDVGFCDQSCLGAAFRRAYGTTPRAYRLATRRQGAGVLAREDAVMAAWRVAEPAAQAEVLAVLGLGQERRTG